MAGGLVMAEGVLILHLYEVTTDRGDGKYTVHRIRVKDPKTVQAEVEAALEIPAIPKVVKVEKVLD
jgi:hypothetical protein